MEVIEPVRPEALLTHREWVQRVARALVTDVHGAADLEQDLWVKVLERPPRIRGSVRGWLAATLRNAFLNRRRGDVRRESRERLTAPSEARPSSAELVANAEAVQRLMGEVLGLEEPYRTTVLLRFYEDLLPAAIAHRMAVPVETVKTRLRRALAVLRDRLDEGSGGAGWLAALLPLTGVRADAGAVAGNSGVAVASALGGTVMTAKATVLVSVGLGVAAGFLGGRLSGQGASGQDASLLGRIEALEAESGRSLGGSIAGGHPDDGDREARTAGRLAEQEGRIQALEAEVAAARKRNEDLLATASVAGPAQRDEGAGLIGLQGLTDEELLEEIRRLSRTRYKTRQDERAGNGKTLQACDLFLGRAVDAPLRVEVLTAKGVAQRALGDVDKADAVLREALSLAGPTTNEGRRVTYQLAITASVRKDNRAAADLLLGVARQSEAPPEERVKFRWWGASYLATVDPQAALAELQGVLGEYGTSEEPGMRHWLEQVRKEVKKLESSSGAK